MPVVRFSNSKMIRTEELISEDSSPLGDRKKCAIKKLSCCDEQMRYDVTCAS